MDIKRLLSKKVLFVGTLIWIFQALVFMGSQIDSMGLDEQRKQNIEYNQAVEELSGQPLADSSRIANERLSSDRNAVNIAIADKITYLAGYEESIQKIFENAKRLEAFSIFQNPDSYSYANTIKTAKDFEKMGSVSLHLDKDRATQHILSFTYLPFFVCAFMIYVIYEILRERDSGMWEATHTMKNGRCVLALNRGISLALIAAAFYLQCFLTNLITACLFYGNDNFGGLIQTIAEYAKYPQPLSKGLYLCVFAAKSIFALVTVVLTAYFVFTVFRNRNLAVVVILAIFAGEWQLMKNIPVYSNMKMLRYINIMQIFDCGSPDREYQNLNILGNAVSASSVLFFAEVLLAVSAFGLAIFIYGKQYPGKSSRFDIVKIHAERFVQKLLEKFPFSAKEAYKILISKKVLIFAGFGVLACVWIYGRTQVNFPDAQKSMDEAYITYGGQSWDVFDDYVEELTGEYEENLMRSQEIRGQIQSGILGPESVPDAHIYENRAANILIYLREYNKKQELRQSVRADKEIDIYVMSDRGYNEIIGPNSMIREAVIGVIVLVLCIIAASHGFGYETSANTKPLLKSSYRGIKYIWKKKILCSIGITCMIIILFYGLDYIALLHEYRIPYLGAPLQSLTFYSENTAHISIMHFLILITLFKAVLPVCAAASVLLISSDKRVVNQMYVPLLIIAYAIIYLLILNSQTVWLIWTLVILFSVLTGICIFASHQKWCG